MEFSLDPAQLDRWNTRFAAEGYLFGKEPNAFLWDWSQAQYDAVVAIFIQFAAPVERARIFAGLRQALAPGGLLVMQG
jgi:hypothetical protein